MADREFHLYGRTREAVVDDAVRKGVHGRTVILTWPPLRDTRAWEALRSLETDEPTTFLARLFPDDLPTTKAYDEYVERYFRFVDSAVEFDEAQTIHGLSSTSRTCKVCSSHVSVGYVEGEACPVCGADLRSNTVHKTIARWRERIAKVREQGEAEATKAGWLGSWAAVSVEGKDVDRDTARHHALTRSYDSEVMELAAGRDERPLYLSRHTYETLAARAREANLSPAAYLDDLLGEQR